MVYFKMAFSCMALIFLMRIGAMDPELCLISHGVVADHHSDASIASIASHEPAILPAGVKASQSTDLAKYYPCRCSGEFKGCHACYCEGPCACAKSLEQCTCPGCACAPSCLYCRQSEHAIRQATEWLLACELRREHFKPNQRHSVYQMVSKQAL